MSFRLHPWATFFTLLGLGLLLTLGTWQLDRYNDARDFERDRDERIDKPVADVQDPARLADGDYDFRRITIEGHWETERLYLINHRVHDGHPGYWIVRPLLVDTVDADDNSPVMVPVNLGWIPRSEGPHRARELLDETPDGPVSITGLLHRLDDVVADDDLRDQLEDGDEPDGVVQLDTYDVVAIDDARPDTSLGRPLVLTRSPDDAPDDGPTASYNHITDPYLTSETHFGYMLTWYTLAAALLLIWLAHGLGLLKSKSYQDPDRRET